jgi:hypothetical protein
MSTIQVRLISAPWCKRCHTLKPEIATLCAITGATLEVINYDDWEEDDPRRDQIKSLPTIFMSVDNGSTWTMYTAATFEEWKTAALASAPLKGSDDF